MVHYNAPPASSKKEKQKKSVRFFLILNLALSFNMRRAEAQVGYSDGRVPAVRPKHHRSHPVHPAAMGGGGGGRWGVLSHHVHLLSVRKWRVSCLLLLHGRGQITPQHFVYSTGLPHHDITKCHSH